MQKKNFYMKRLSWLVYDFYKREDGVYALMTGMLSFFLMGLAAFAVDGSGILLDKARLSQGMEQGSLAVVAENNEFRDPDTQAHSDVTRQVLSEAEKSNLTKEQGLKKQQSKRNQELVKGFVQLYLPDVKINEDFNIKCARLKDNDGKILKTVECDVSGAVDRPSWLYLEDNLKDDKGNKATFDKEVKLATGITSVQKNLDEVIPLDLMLVTDLTGSMNYSTTSTQPVSSPHRKLDQLRDVVASLAKDLLEEAPSSNEDKKAISPYNRIGFTSFAFGAQQQNNRSQCYLPYFFNTSAQESTINDFMRNISRQANDKVTRVINDLNNNIDYSKTLNNIKSFNGSTVNYPVSYSKNSWCLNNNRNSANTDTTKLWFAQGHHNDLVRDFNRVEAAGATLSSSGVLIGANLLMNKNTDNKASPSELKNNTQRILLVLSDGKDEIWKDKPPKVDITVKLINQGMCDEIRSRLDSLQDEDYVTRKSKIAFVAFGYGPEGEQKTAWKKCVGSEYYEAKNKKELLEAFRQIVGLTEEAGHIKNK